jgi:hypothetical protein
MNRGEMNKQQAHVHLGRLAGEQWLPQSYSEHSDNPTWCQLEQPQDILDCEASWCVCVCGSIMLSSVVFHNKLNSCISEQLLFLLFRS